MSNKRVLAREWKQKRVQKKRITIASLILAAVLIATGFGLYGLDLHRRSYVMTFEGTRVNTNDMRFALLSAFMAEADDPNTYAMDLLLETLVLEHRAGQNGITLSEEEQEEMLAEASFMMQYMAQMGIDASFLSIDRVAGMLSTDRFYQYLMDMYTAHFEIDEAEFQITLADHLENNKARFYDMEFKYVYTESLEEIEFGREQLLSGEITFDEFVERFSILYEEEVGVSTLPLQNLGIEEADTPYVLNMAVGDISEVLTVYDSYFLVVQLESLFIPSDEEVEADLREEFSSRHRREMFEEILQGWIDEATFTINQRGMDAI